MVSKDAELLKNEETMLEQVEEISQLKEKLEEFELGGGDQATRIRELELEKEELMDEYEQNKKDLYEQLDQKDQSLREITLQLTDAQK